MAFRVGLGWDGGEGEESRCSGTAVPCSRGLSTGLSMSSRRRAANALNSARSLSARPTKETVVTGSYAAAVALHPRRPCVSCSLTWRGATWGYGEPRALQPLLKLKTLIFRSDIYL